MAISYTQVERELGKFLSAIPGMPVISWPSIPFSPPDGPWVRPTFLPAQSADVTIGIDGVANFPGIYLINVFGPNGRGVADVNEMADTIINAFRSSRSINTASLNIHIESAWRSPSLTDDQYYQVPVNIRINFIG